MSGLDEGSVRKERKGKKGVGEYSASVPDVSH